MGGANVNRSRKFWVRWGASMLCASLAMLASHAQAEQKTSSQTTQSRQAKWVIVQPAFAEGFRFDTAAAFAEELSRMRGHSVSVDAATRGKGVEAFRWSLTVAPQQPSVLILPEEAVLMGESRKAHPAHVSNFEPLLVLGFKRWCAFVHESSPLQDASQLRGWVGQLDRPVRIALPLSAGRMELWVQGMRHSTQHPWQVQTYRINGDFAAALSQGADLALARCDRLGAQSAKLRVLVQSGHVRSAQQADIPTFEQAGWLPLEHGWSAFFAPSVIPVEVRAEMAQALHHIASTASIRKGLMAADFQPADLSPSASRAYIERFVSGWELVEQFLQGQHTP